MTNTIERLNHVVEDKEEETKEIESNYNGYFLNNSFLKGRLNSKIYLHKWGRLLYKRWIQNDLRNSTEAKVCALQTLFSPADEYYSLRNFADKIKPYQN